MIGERPRPELRAHCSASLGTRIDDRDQLAALRLRVFLRVKAPEIAHPDDCGSDFLHGDAIMPAPMATTTPTPPAAARARALSDSYRALPPRVRRELIIYGVTLLAGLLGMPLLIWLAGNRVLGPYTHGQNLHAGPFALLGDFMLGLAHGSAVFWVVALGPAVLLLLLRVMIWLIRAIPSTRRG